MSAFKKILITTPYSRSSRHGNTVSGKRISRILAGLGFQTDLVSTFDSTGTLHCADLMIALNARKSGEIVSQFKRQSPNSPLVLFLTGTDLHVDLPKGGRNAQTVMDSLRLADVVVLAQQCSTNDVPEEFSYKVRVILKSVDISVPAYNAPADSTPLVIVSAAHFRDIKNPEQAIRISSKFDFPAKVHFFGNADGYPEEKLQQLLADTENFQWRGEVTRQEFLQSLAHSHVFLNTSLVEGGSNALLEAMQIGVPIVATKVAGNVGLLGNKYPGLFEPDNDTELLNLIRQCRDNMFRKKLSHLAFQRSTHFSVENETLGWQNLLNDLDKRLPYAAN